MLANEAFSDLENAYVFRERTKKRDGEVPIGRLSRVFSSVSIGNSSASPWTFDLFPFATGLSGAITAITNANPGQVTSTAHGLTSGTQVRFIGVGGMTQLNGNVYTVTFVDANNFTIGVDTTTYGTYTSGGIWINQPGAEISAGSVVIVIGGVTFTDQGNGTLTSVTPGNSGVINYITGQVTLTTTVAAGTAATATFSYFPALPVMGILKRDVSTVGIDQTVFFDTRYA